MHIVARNLGNFNPYIFDLEWKNVSHNLLECVGCQLKSSKSYFENGIIGVKSSQWFWPKWNLKLCEKCPYELSTIFGTTRKIYYMLCMRVTTEQELITFKTICIQKFIGGYYSATSGWISCGAEVISTLHTLETLKWP